LTVSTSNNLQATITLLSLLTTDSTLCASCSIVIRVCLQSFTCVCYNTPSFTVTIGACVVVTYTVAAYPDFSYNLGSGTQTTPYPTFTQTPACNYVPTKTVTVNNNPFPGVNLVGGASMSAFFTDDTTNKRFSINNANLNHGTNTYTFVFTSTVPSIST